jgi:hypothetical protein
MSEHRQAPASPQNILRMLVIGVLLAFAGIGLFLVLLFALPMLGLGDFERIVVAVCLPPVLLGTLLGAVVLAMRRAPSAEEPAHPHVPDAGAETQSTPALVRDDRLDSQR